MATVFIDGYNYLLDFGTMNIFGYSFVRKNYIRHRLNNPLSIIFITITNFRDIEITDILGIAASAMNFNNGGAMDQN